MLIASFKAQTKMKLKDTEEKDICVEIEYKKFIEKTELKKEGR